MKLSASRSAVIERLNVEQKQDYLGLVGIIDRWSALGVKEFASGATYVGHTPGANYFYVHFVKPPLSEEGLEKLQDEVNYDFPESLIAFFRLHNGIGLFHCMLNIYGLQTYHDRLDIEAMSAQPFSMQIPNTIERPKSAHKDLLFIGSAGTSLIRVCCWADGSICYWDKSEQAPTEKRYRDVFAFLYGEAKIIDSGLSLNPSLGDIAH
jgi:hypothetical protein